MEAKESERSSENLVEKLTSSITEAIKEFVNINHGVCLLDIIQAIKESEKHILQLAHIHRCDF